MRTLFWIVLIAGLCIALFGCGGGAAALPFGSPAPDESAQPVTCQPAGCAQ